MHLARHQLSAETSGKVREQSLIGESWQVVDTFNLDETIRQRAAARGLTESGYRADLKAIYDNALQFHANEEILSTNSFRKIFREKEISRLWPDLKKRIADIAEMKISRNGPKINISKMLERAQMAFEGLMQRSNWRPIRQLQNLLIKRSTEGNG